MKNPLPVQENVLEREAGFISLIEKVSLNLVFMLTT